MKLGTPAAAAAALALTSTLGLAALRGAQMGPPRPTEQHRTLQQLVGEWTFSMEMSIPGMGPMEFEGTETFTPLGELWVRGDVESESMGMPFRGLNVLGYDASEEKVVSYWFDSMSDACDYSEGAWDAEGGRFVLEAEKTDERGAPVTERTVLRFPDEDTFHMEVSRAGADGSEEPFLSMHYRRADTE